MLLRNTNTILGLLLLLLAPFARANELPGYPYDVLSVKSQYECLEAKQVQTEDVRILYDLCIDNKLGPDVKNLLRQAFPLFVDRMMSLPVYNCIKSNLRNFRFGI